MSKSSISQEKLELLYSSGKSMFDISQELACSVNKIVYWMRKYGIKRRSWSEATYVKLNPNGDPFTIKKDLLKSQDFLYGLGLGIYFGEGEKVSNHAVRVANTDSRLLRLFIRFLKEVCGIKNDKIHYSIICFNDTDPKFASDYWSKELNIKDYKFGKIVQIPPQGKGTYKRKSLHGVCSVTVSNIKLKKWIQEEIAVLEQMPS